MRSKVFGYVIALTVGVGFCGSAWAQKNRNKNSDSTDKAIEKQSEWENKVMGEDAAKKGDMKKIAEAKRLADEAAKHPQPEAAPKRKDPNKEGVRAKQEASIGLPIASDEPAKVAKKSAPSKKAEPTSSSNDALGALVASSLAEEKSADASAKAKGNRTKGGGKGKSAKSGGSSSLDQMFAAGK